MSDNLCSKSCVNRSPTTEQSVPTPPPSGDVGTSVFQIAEHLSEIYKKRIDEINEQANGDATLKEITYKEWIDMLRNINKTLITNIQEMDHETTTESLALLQRRVSANCRYTQDSELCKCRKDMAGLMQLVRNGRRCGDWSVDKFNFETITKQDIFGNDTSCCEPSEKYETECSKHPSTIDPRSCANQKSKLVANVKALAFEVADKHDEIRDLKKQILSMEDEIQKAQKKIQLKDDVIRELRNDLKSLPKCSTVWNCRTSDRSSPNACCLPMTEVKSPDMDITPRPGGCYSNRESINSLNFNPIESDFGINILDEEDDDEEEFIKCLKEELNQLFEMRRAHDQDVEDQTRAMKDKQNRLNDMVDKLLKSNTDFQNKLRFYRRELINLENPHSSRTITDGDSGISSDSDPDVKIVNSVRKRICSLFEDNYQLKKDEQCLQIKYEDVNSKVLAKSNLLEKTSKALREVAETLSDAMQKPIAYEVLFEENDNITDNPIVDAVNSLIVALKERDKKLSELQKQATSTGKRNQELESNSQKLEAELCELKQSVRESNFTK